MMAAPAQRDGADGRTARAETIIWYLLQISLVVVSLAFSDGADVYRLPKQLLFAAAAVVLGAACVMTSILDPRRGIVQRVVRYRVPMICAAAAVLWTGLTAAVSTNRLLSIETLAWVICCAIIFAVTVTLSSPRGLEAVAAPLIAPALVAATAILQRTGIWNPFRFDPGVPIRLRTSGFIGNPDDAGVYLAVPLMAALALATVVRGKARAASLALALLLLCGLFATETLTAVIAVAVGGLVLGLIVSRRVAVRAAIAALLVAGVLIAAGAPGTERFRSVAREARKGNWNIALSYRLESYLAAWTMFTDRPLVGLGPGSFSYWYLPYKGRLSGPHPEFLLSTQNYHDVHNDHLQILATTGLPGYAIFAAAVIALASISRLPPSTGPQRRFARLFAAPAAATIVLITLGQFPLELAAPTMLLLYFSGVAVAWSDAS